MATVTVEVNLCERCHSELDLSDIRCPVCSLATPLTKADDVSKTAVEILRCGGCGAAVSYNVRAAAPKCAFCGSVTEVETPENPMEQADRFLPFTVDRSSAEAAFRRWIGGLGWFRPSDLRARGRIEKMRALWWVGWVIDAEAAVSWTADSDAGTGRADWAPHAGRLDMVFDDVVSPASRGLTADETARLLESHDLTTAVAVETRPESDAVMEQFDVRRSQAREHVANMIDGLVRQRLQSGVIPGGRFRNVNAAVLARHLATRRVGFPAWVMAYRYRHKLYRFVLSGQEPSCLMGDAPVSIAKIVFAVLGGAVGLLFLLSLLAGLM